ncbi:hypothetical protein R1sor_024797 [Riccia sorocarpa]|uniref:EF-hand domain-containing protein n=1 Tax=Riccia sorocarpa TaxID=122646 RepID=A0ABD3GTE7_9MARC
MAIISFSNNAEKLNGSGFSLFDLAMLFEALGVQGNKKELESKFPWLTSVPSKAERPLVQEKSSSTPVENRCDESGQKDGTSECTRSGVQGNLDLEISELTRMFHAVDENQDGLICADDLRRFMGKLGQELSEEDAASMLSSVDQDKDGRVGFEEFCTLYKSLDGSKQSSLAGEEKVNDDEDEDLKEAFRLYDKNNDGYISCQELQAVLVALGIPEGKSLKSCEHMIRGVDLDGNGQVDIKEFKRMIRAENMLTFTNSDKDLREKRSSDATWVISESHAPVTKLFVLVSECYW